MTRIAILDGIRTPFAKAGGVLSQTPAHELGRLALQELMERSAIPRSAVDEVIFGNVAQPMEATNISRVIALNAGFPLKTSAHTVARNCASGMQAIATGYELIRCGSADVVVSGGTESMSNIPLLFPKSMSDFLVRLQGAKTLSARLSVIASFRPSMLKPIIALVEGLKDPFCGLNMGQTAEVLAKEFGLSRQAQDAFATQSHLRAARATADGTLAQEIVPLFLPHLASAITTDVGFRASQTIEALAKLKPFFDRKHGTVTVGNSCPITDGAVALMLAREDRVQALGLKPLAWIHCYAFAGLDPKRMGLGPVASTAKALQRGRLHLRDVGLLEINEAFAAQVLSVLKVFAQPHLGETYGATNDLCEVDPESLNVNGGAIALGHPVGSSGARIVLTLAKELQRRDVTYGLATMCVGGGQGGTIILEKA